MGAKLAHADDCGSTLYEDEFNCKSKKVYSYCSSGAKADRKNVKYDLYESVYCNSKINDKDKLYETVASQLAAEDPKWNKDLVKYTLKDLTTTGISAYLEGKYNDKTSLDKLPKAVQDAYKVGSIGDVAKIYERVKSAYDKQKVLQHAQESLKQQFKAREMWANASLSDSPFDLVVDLNLIEMMLFGNNASWTSANDVWKWPEDEETKQKAAKNKTPASSTSAPSTPSSSSATAPTASSSADEYVCTPNKINAVTSPLPGVVPLNCGNKTLDKGEECDDGNTIAGDGCSESCKKETGANLQCKDTETITFKTFKVQPAVNKSASSADSSNKIPLNCPPGSTATKKSSADEKKVIQSSNYPGPLIGGVLKKFPPSKKSKCPPGMKWTQIKIGGEAVGTCFPMQFCADPDKIREFLFGKEYEKDPQKKDVAAAIEVAICVNIEQIKVPESPYSVNDGCIDCHIMAMNDVMKKMLEKDIVPKQNTTQAWGTSNRWGPAFSFNLHTLIGRPTTPVIKPKNMNKATALLPVPEKNNQEKQLLQTQQDAYNKKDLSKEQNQPSPVVARSMELLIERSADAEEEAQKKILQSLKNYRAGGEGSIVQENYTYLKTLLNALNDSFAHLTNEYMQMSLSNNFIEKDQCSF